MLYPEPKLSEVLRRIAKDRELDDAEFLREILKALDEMEEDAVLDDLPMRVLVDLLDVS